MTSQTKGILFILGAAMSFALMSVFVHLAGDIPAMQKAFFRNIVALMLSSVILWRQHISFRLPQKRDWIPLLARAAFGTLGLLCNFYAIDHLALSDATILNKMSPFFAIIMSWFLLKEKISLKQGLFVAAAFAGSLLVIKPNPANMAFFPSCIGLLGGFGAGVAYTFVRLCTKRGMKSGLIVFIFSAFSCLLCLPYVIAVHAPMRPAQLGCLFLAGVFGCSGQFTITAAYRFAPAKDISVYDYTQVVFAALLGWSIFGQLPDHWSVLGYAVIIGSGTAMFIYQKRRHNDEQSRVRSGTEA